MGRQGRSLVDFARKANALTLAIHIKDELTSWYSRLDACAMMIKIYLSRCHVYRKISRIKDHVSAKYHVSRASCCNLVPDLAQFQNLVSFTSGDIYRYLFLLMGQLRNCCQ